MPKSLISIRDFSKDEILHILDVAKEFEKNREQNFLAGKVIACLFFEPSTRTRLSFEAAVNRLGARVIGFSDTKNTSVSKGETLEDTIKIVSNYVDMIVMRHPNEGAAAIAASVSPVPVVNAGDGSNQHPTQTLLDMYSIMQTQGHLDNLTINMVGDLKYGRTVHSLSEAMSDFNPSYIFTAPEELKMPHKYIDMLKEKNIPFEETDSLEAHIAELEEQLATAEEDKKALDETVGLQSNQLRALDWLLEIENAYNTGDLDAAKDNIRSFEETGTVEFLPKEPLRTGITGDDAPSPAARYQSIVDKLFPDGVK